jgi:tyrosyl-tRNA synthetase
MVGDPSGRSTERVLQDEAAVAANARGIANVLSRFLPSDASSPRLPAGADVSSERVPDHSPIMANNLDWYSSMSIVTFLRDVGKHFRVAAMLGKDSVKSRMEDNGSTGLSFTEFSYQTLQGYDFHVLKQKYGCSVQIGGSDQWGNITAGIDYIHRSNAILRAEHEANVKKLQSQAKKAGKSGKNSKDAAEAASAEQPAVPELRLDDEAHGLTLPLLVTAAGVKFGKSAGNALWLDARKTSPYALYQYMLQTADQDVCKMLKLLTTLDTPTVDEVARRHASMPDVRLGQRLLAREVVLQLHGERGWTQAQVATEVLFAGKGKQEALAAGEDGLYQGLSADEFLEALTGVPR